MRLSLEAGPGEAAAKGDSLARAVAHLCTCHGLDPHVLLVDLAGALDLELRKAGAPADSVEPAYPSMRAAVADLDAWYAGVLIPSMVDQILEVLREPNPPLPNADESR